MFAVCPTAKPLMLYSVVALINPTRRKKPQVQQLSAMK
jgi:hypothetical protein